MSTPKQPESDGVERAEGNFAFRADASAEAATSSERSSDVRSDLKSNSETILRVNANGDITAEVNRNSDHTQSERQSKRSAGQAKARLLVSFLVFLSLVVTAAFAWLLVTNNWGPTHSDRKPSDGVGPPSGRSSSAASTVATAMLQEVDYSGTANQLGLIAMFTGPETPAEDQRIREYIATSATIRFMAYTGERFVVKFKPELEQFFRRSGTRMEVLLADPSDPFYINNTILTEPATEQPGGSVSGFTGNQLGTKTQLIGCGAKPEQLLVKQFTNQMRLPAIIFDQVCVLTVRLPNSRRQTIRMEYKNISEGYYSQVSDHFNVVWSKAMLIPEVKVRESR